MVYNAEREHRDARAKAAHEEQIGRTGEKRVLMRAINGELVSYTPEEYGVGRLGLGPRINTRWGHLVYVLAIAAVIAVFLYLPLQGLLVEGDTETIGFLVIPALLIVLEAYAVRNLIREWRAHKLREERGLPRPAY
ncbi:hypothetical protein GCM10027404_01270 [Arthrobacter tumbae]|uniref:hypothetical protein n=1 Tax=Arthrobacter tumbae TaxID=163874 RepID=UPI00195A970E|nr:hypothetical protein [Arthrobacter tumbae]MBM7780428.1 hypothetical protein [Arthrobacter tumbae]